MHGMFSYSFAHSICYAFCTHTHTERPSHCGICYYFYWTDSPYSIRTYILHITRCLLALRSLLCLCSCSKLSSNNIWARLFVVRACFLYLPPLSHVPNSEDPEHDKYYENSCCESKSKSKSKSEREMTNRVVCLCHVYEHTIRSRLARPDRLIARRGTCCSCSAPHLLTTTISNTNTARFRFSILFPSIRK